MDDAVEDIVEKKPNVARRVAWLLRKFGPKITPFIDKYFNLLAIVFTALLIGGVLLIKYVL